MSQTEILRQCLEIGKEAYTQELSRQKTIINKAEYLMKFHTLLIAILNLSLPLIIKYVELKNSALWRVFYILTMACLLMGIIFTLLIQRPRKIAMFQTGTSVLKEVQKKGDLAYTEDEWLYKKLLLSDRMTLSLERANNFSVRWIVMAYVFFVLSIILMGAFFAYVIW